MIFFPTDILLVSTPHVSAQILNSSLPLNQPACLGQQITFTCEVQAGSLAGLALAWSSDDYIGGGGAQIQFGASTDSPGLRRPSATNQDTVAEYTALLNGSNGPLRLVSTLHVRVSSILANPSVSCIDIGTGSIAVNSFTVLGMLAINVMDNKQNNNNHLFGYNNTRILAIFTILTQELFCWGRQLYFMLMFVLGEVCNS